MRPYEFGACEFLFPTPWMSEITPVSEANGMDGRATGERPWSLGKPFWENLFGGKRVRPHCIPSWVQCCRDGNVASKMNGGDVLQCR